MTTRFRLTMSTQCGEKLARDEGYKAFPVNPIAIARKHGIHVEQKRPEMSGISGALIFAGNNPIIIYSTEHANKGFENFSVAHELGHYFLPGHPEEIQRAGGAHMSRSGFSEGNSSIEIEADHFAAGLLMPHYLVRQTLGAGQVGLQGIRQLANQANASLTAAAIRAAQCAQFPLCIIVSSGKAVSYAFPSERFKALGRNIFLRKGSALAAGSATAALNARPADVLAAAEMTGECCLSDWFDTNRSVTLDEEVIGLGKYGLALTVLSSEPLTLQDDDDEDEDAALEESWTPRFAYGR
nr:ImmA/IrrE family metallo-endopeptidase [Nitrosomonas nitrosa]